MITQIDGLPIFHMDRGKGRPFIVFHGSPSDHSRAMEHIEPAFFRRRGWHRVYPDLPGHGRTPRSRRIRDMDDYLGVILRFVDKVTSRGSFCVGGISFGAYIALGVARQRKDRIDGLLLSVPQINHSPAEERRDRAHRVQTRQPAMATPAPRPGYVEDTEWLESLPFRDVSLELYGGHGQLDAPALFLLGRRDAPFRAETYWRMLPEFPEATFAILGGAGHRLWSERNEVACALTRDWAERVETSDLS